MFVERFDVVGQFLVITAVTLVTLRKLQQHSVQLLDMIFGERNVRPRIEDHFRCLCIARNFLFISRCKRTQIEIREQGVDFRIGQFRAFNSCGCSDRFHRRHPSQGCEPIGRKIPEGLPGSFKFVDLSDEPEQVRRERGVLEGMKGGSHTRKYTRKYPKGKSGIYGYRYGYGVDRRL
jgi:hypothetical protein